PRRSRLVAAAAAVGTITYSLLVGRDWMPHFRFLVPAIAPLLALCVAGAVEGSRRLGGRRSAGFVVLAIAGLAALEAAGGHRLFRLRRDDPLWYRDPTLRADRLLARSLVAVRWLEASTAP